MAPDYHIEIAGHFYSVPSKLIREVVEVRITSATVEVFHKGQRIAAHLFSPLRNRHTTQHWGDLGSRLANVMRLLRLARS